MKYWRDYKYLEYDKGSRAAGDRELEAEIRETASF